ncbi:hypothetical protein EDB81DRAFT_644183 [Dactylonectria macrodidyma]|uniref:FAD-binding FR-type domain-containing protein n=1 Tax=Dactylonectria macrodidyma TaxID=307937 RepID=A0A9P9JH74_9HYPO|nr:hypothetical protein EDB81DRAFT_644183 [Dactylonectria macrodidyma]
MGCLGHRKKQTEEMADQRWEYINLKDFKSQGCGAIFAYIYLWFMLFISVAVYAADGFTAVNLLAFNRWSSGIDPAIDIDISKWIFSICIILSVLNLGYEGFRAFRVIRRGNVAECYLDSLAVRWESIRLGSGLGFRRFLVFAELTKSKKGAEYIALFTYFSFQSWIRVIICSGPRQVINAFTIKAVYDSKLAISSQSVEGSITGFFEKIKALAEEDYRQALTLSGMCFTLVVWTFSALFLLAAVLFWVFFLWHWIPSADGGLSGYCSRKVTKTLMKIVTKTVNKALARQEADRLRAGAKAAKRTGEKPPLDRVATLPTLPNLGPADDDKIPSMPMLGRNDTMMTLPPYTSRPGTPGAVEMSNMDQKRAPLPAPSRSGTMASNASYSSRAPLVSAASEMGYGRAPSPTSQVPGMDLGNYPQSRPTAAGSHGNYDNYDDYDNSGSYGPRAPLRPMLSTTSLNRFTETPGPMHSEATQLPPPARAPSARPFENYAQPGASFVSSPTSAPASRSYEAYNPDGRTSPEPSPNSHFDGQQRPMNQPMRSVTGPFPSREPQYPPQRNMTAPMPSLPAVGEHFDRYSTTSSVASGSIAPSSVVLPGSSMRASPAPHMGPSPGPGGPHPSRGLQYPPQRSMTAPSAGLPPVGEYSDRNSMTSSVTSSSMAPSSVVLPGAGMRASPAPRMEFHEGERAMHRLLKVQRNQDPTALGLPTRYGVRVMQSSLVALGTLDDAGRPWTTVWGGERGFARPVAENVLAFNSPVDTRYDPVFKALWEGTEVDDDAVARPGGGEGKGMAGLSIDLETRDRVKLMGKMVAGASVNGGKEVQMAMVVTGSLGNCPKYLNRKDVVFNEMKPELVSDSLPLPREALELIDKADMFFLSSTNGETMDTNHRGGSPGLVRVIKNGADGLELIYPEFSGNRLYQTLGNFKVNPLVGITVPDFDTGDVVYFTGSASILVGEEASSILARTQLAVKISVTAARFVKSGLPFRGAPVEYSPYNPPTRHLLSEHDTHIASSQSDISANLTKRETLTPTVNRYTFQLSSQSRRALEWHAGQYVTFDFASEVSAGYSHMRDEDPQSLNDDYVRTFTVSSLPGSNEMQITARKNGPVTNFLSRHNLRVPLDIPVLGFGGEEAFRIPLDLKAPPPVFIAAGVGITPLLAQAQAVLDAGIPLKLLWTLRGEDVPLAADTFAKVPALAAATTLFVTGQAEQRRVEQFGAEVEMRRIRLEDVDKVKGQGARFYLCTGPALLTALTSWLEGEKVVWEDFGY